MDVEGHANMFFLSRLRRDTAKWKRCGTLDPSPLLVTRSSRLFGIGTGFLRKGDDFSKCSKSDARIFEKLLMHILDNERLVLTRVMCECICRTLPNAIIFGSTPHNMWILSQCPSVRRRCDTINVVMEFSNVDDAPSQAYQTFKKLRATLMSFGTLKQCKPPVNCQEFQDLHVMHLMFHYRCGYLQSKYTLLKIRLNVVFTTKRDKRKILNNKTCMTTKSTNNTARTLLDVQTLCKKSSKAQFDFTVTNIEDKEIDALCMQNHLLFISSFGS